MEVIFNIDKNGTFRANKCNYEGNIDQTKIISTKYQNSGTFNCSYSRQAGETVRGRGGVVL